MNLTQFAGSFDREAARGFFEANRDWGSTYAGLGDGLETSYRSGEITDSGIVNVGDAASRLRDSGVGVANLNKNKLGTLVQQGLVSPGELRMGLGDQFNADGTPNVFWQAQMGNLLDASILSGFAAGGISFKGRTANTGKGSGDDATISGGNGSGGNDNVGGAPNRGAGGFYDPRTWRKNYDDFYNGNVTSTTVPPYSAKNVQLAGQRHAETGVVFDQRGYPVFDSHTAYDTRFTGSDFSSSSYQTQMRMGTRDLLTTIESNPQLRSQFDATQLQAIQSGNAKIPGYTWHHHQDTGRLQLVDETVHRRTGHIGGEAMSGGQ